MKVLLLVFFIVKFTIVFSQTNDVISSTTLKSENTDLVDSIPGYYHIGNSANFGNLYVSLDSVINENGILQVWVISEMRWGKINDEFYDNVIKKQLISFDIKGKVYCVNQIENYALKDILISKTQNTCLYKTLPDDIQFTKMFDYIKLKYSK